MQGKKSIFLLVLILTLAASACSAPQTEQPQIGPTAAPTQTTGPVLTEPPAKLPSTEADVPRVAVEDAKAALDSGEAIIVDVRDPALYEQGHITGAVSIWLEDIEANPTGLNLNKDQWIITYCT